MKKTVLFGLLLCASINTWAWGEKGHKMVAQIAKKCLDKSIIDSVQFYLGKMSFKRASVWMDEVRKDSEYDFMKPWHYINIEKDSAYKKNNEENAVNEIEKAIAVLKRKGPRNKDTVANALRIIFHLIGDLHQPLHAGYAEDKGGNHIDVDYFGQATNLHRVWDTHIIEREKIRLKDCYTVANSLTNEEGQNLQTINIAGWMLESRALLPGAYDFEKRIITRAYVEKNKEIIKKQLVKAGIRLAAVLYQTFKK